jgi:hypothetical protein
MGWALKQGVSFCIADGQVIFLKLAEDRYVRPAAALNARFLDWLDAKGSGDAPPPKSVQKDLLEWRDAPSAFPAPCFHAAATDALAIPNTVVLAAAPVAATALLRARLEVAIRPLNRVVEGRQHPISRTPASNCDREHASRFLAARAWLPMKRRCLPDSLALFDHLAKRGCRPTLLLGVVPEPFAAHCWVQHGGTVLNDRLDIVSRFTPILVV